MPGMGESMNTTAQPEALRLAALCDSYRGALDLEPVAAELRRQHALLNSPELVDFSAGVVREAAHQRERWGSIHDGGKSPEDWYWLIGHLAGRALAHHKEAERLDGEISHPSMPGHEVLLKQIAHHREKAVHHCITTAAALANWHAAALGKTNMRPGVDPAVVLAAAGVVA